MSTFTIYHNTRCKSSCRALELLRSKGAEVEVVEYLSHPQDRATLERLLQAVGGDPMALLRTSDPKFVAAGLDPQKKLSAAEVVQTLLDHPEVMQRPIVVKGSKAVIARPPEKVLEIF